MEHFARIARARIAAHASSGARFPEELILVLLNSAAVDLVAASHQACHAKTAKALSTLWWFILAQSKGAGAALLQQSRVPSGEPPQLAEAASTRTSGDSQGNPAASKPRCTRHPRRPFSVSEGFAHRQVCAESDGNCASTTGKQQSSQQELPRPEVEHQARTEPVRPAQEARANDRRGTACRDRSRTSHTTRLHSSSDDTGSGTAGPAGRAPTKAKGNARFNPFSALTRTAKAVGVHGKPIRAMLGWWSGALHSRQAASEHSSTRSARSLSPRRF
jgi:hypothetical protein